MNRIVLSLAGVLLLMSGCTLGIKCDSSTVCPTGGTCHPELKVCVTSTDGGNMGGGGGAPGGGGGSTGGGGGATGGGGGMLVDYCDAGLTCAGWQECAPSAGGGACADTVTGLSWLTPSDGLRTNLPSIPGTVQVTGPGGALTVPVRSSTGGRLLDFAVSGGQASGMLALVEGPQTFVAGWEDGGPTASVTVTMDTQGPNLSTTLPAGARQRDDILVLGLSADEAVEPTSIELSVGGVLMGRSDAGCAASAGCWEANLSLPVLNGMDGGFAVTARAVDLAGNTKTSSLGTVQVTRRRWETQPTVQAIRAAPAIGIDGTLFVGAADVTSALYALNPADGGAMWPPANIGAIQSLATANNLVGEVVYYSANDGTGGKVGGRLASNLSASGINPAAFGNNNGFTSSAIALVSKSANEVGAVAAFNSNGASPSAVVVYSPSLMARGLDALDGGPTYNFASVPSLPYETASNIIISGSEAWLLTSPPGGGLHWNSVNSINNNPATGVRQVLEASPRNCCLGGQARLPDGSALVSGSTIAADKLYRVSGSGVASGNLTTAVDNGVPVVGVGNNAFVGRGADLVRFNAMQLTSAGVALYATGDAIRTSPVLGRARAGQPVGVGYAVTSTGTLIVFAQDGAAGSAENWGAVFPVGINLVVYAHPTLDCNRRPGAATATTGVLYVAAGSGRVAAIIVDSPALLDTAGAWPKFQRTAGNAGNTDTARFPFNPGCP